MARIPIQLPESSFSLSENGVIVGEDRLSSLPDSIIADEILSLLPIKSAAKTSVLSPRWRHLWTQVSHLHFSCDELGTSFDFFTTVDHILRQLTSPKISSFCLLFNTRFNEIKKKRQGFSYVDAWIHRICSLNPEKIEVGHYGSRVMYPLPSCIFECQSLVSLDLAMGGFVYSVPHIISLPNLKKLAFFLFHLSRDAMINLLKSCPSLEVLDLKMLVLEDGNFVDLSSRNLNRLSINIRGRFSCCKVMIDAPKLKHITLEKRYPSSLIHFMSIPSELIEVDLGRIDPAENVSLYGSDHLETSLELLRGISSTRSLNLNASLFCALNYVDDSVRPIFHNLTFLTMRLNDTRVFDDFLDTLHYAPSLKELIISNEYVVVRRTEWGVPDSVPTCLLSKLEKIRIWDLEGRREELQFLKYILSNANVLEQLHVRMRKDQVTELGEELDFCKSLFRYPRSSSTCEIDFSGNYLSASSTNFKGTSLGCELHVCD